MSGCLFRSCYIPKRALPAAGQLQCAAAVQDLHNAVQQLCPDITQKGQRQNQQDALSVLGAQGVKACQHHQWSPQTIPSCTDSTHTQQQQWQQHAGQCGSSCWLHMQRTQPCAWTASSSRVPFLYHLHHHQQLQAHNSMSLQQPRGFTTAASPDQQHHQQQHHHHQQQEQQEQQELPHHEEGGKPGMSEPASWAAKWRQQRLQQQQQASSTAAISWEDQLEELRQRQQPLLQQQQQQQQLQQQELEQQQQQQRWQEQQQQPHAVQHLERRLVQQQQRQQQELEQQRQEQQQQQQEQEQRQRELQQQQQQQEQAFASNFAELGVPKLLCASLSALHIYKPTPVQCEAWPAIMTGRNVAIQSPTGTGKTLSYLLPLLSRLRPWDPSMHKVPYRSQHTRVLVICPTQELCMQVLRAARALLPRGPRFAHPVVGGSNSNKSAEALKRHNPFLVTATPGRLLKMCLQRPFLSRPTRRPAPDGTSPLGSATVVLEEVDKLSAMDDFKQLLLHLSWLERHRLSALREPPTLKEHMRGMLEAYQMILVSASLQPGALQSASVWSASDPLMVTSQASADITPAARAAAAAVAAASVNSKGQPTQQQIWSQMLPNTITHQVLLHDGHNGRRLLCGVLSVYASQHKKVLVFVRAATSPLKVAAEVQQAVGNKIKVGALYTAQSGDKRASTLSSFNRGDTDVLFTSDGFGLGLDYQAVDVVICYDALAPTRQVYVTRAGRTGRMGRPGCVLSLLPKERLPALKHQLKRVTNDIQEVVLLVPRRGKYQLELKTIALDFDKPTWRGRKH